LEEVSINAPSRKYQDAQHSIVGRVNLGARIAPNASRKCQENLFKLSKPCKRKRNLSKQGQEALIPGVGKGLDSRRKHRILQAVVNTLQFVQEFELAFSSLTSPF